MMRLKLSVIGLALLGVLVTLTPPGLCPCWLLAQVERTHVHPAGDEHQSHSHDYLFDLFNTHSPVSAPKVNSAATVLAGLVAAVLQRVRPAPEYLGTAIWRAEAEVPPPRATV